MCPEREDLGRTYSKVCQILTIFLVFMSSLLMIIILDDNRTVVKIVATIQFSTAIISIIAQIILGRIRKTDKRLKGGVKRYRVYGFER
jgi:hypothetical protein